MGTVRVMVEFGISSAFRGWVRVRLGFCSPNQVLTHAARAAAKQPLVAARGAREGLWLEQGFWVMVSE